MGFVDDILDMNKCGKDIKNMHEETVDQINKRKLQVNTGKSVRIHVGGKTNSGKSCCEDLYVDEWSVEKNKTDAGFTLEDKYKGKAKVKTVEKYEYLGNVIEFDGANKETIRERVGKGLAAVRDIGQILDGCFFGDYYIEALKLKRNSYNIEVIHNITKK